MNGIQSSFYAVGIALCLFSTGILSGRTKRTGQPLSCFAIYLSLEALCFVLELLASHPATPLKALWLGLLMAVSLLIAPALWLAIKESIEGVHPNWASFRWRHRAPIIAGSLLTVPLIATSHFGTGFIDSQRTSATLLEPVIHETMLLCIAIFALQVPFYLWRCRRLLLDKRSSGQIEQKGVADPSSWLQIPLVIVCTTWLIGLARTLTSAVFDGGEEFFALAAFLDVSVTVGCVYLIVRQIACAARPPEFAPASFVEATQETLIESKYAKSQLDAAIRARIVRKLQAAFESEGIYEDARLSLGSLSRHLRENEHYVSQVINQELETSFYEFVNQHRIERATKLLIESPQRNVLDVALAVGFNAKSTFNNAFRRHTGKTPSEFRRSSPPRTPA